MARAVALPWPAMFARWLTVPVLALLIACKGADSGGSTKTDIDSDPLALLPASALVVASVDMQAIEHAGTGGAALAAVTDTFLPLGEDAGFVPSRDLDRILVGEYGTTGTDVVGVMSGRFDADKIGSVSKTKGGASIAAGRYVGFAMYTAGTFAYAPLSPHTLVAGTGDGVRRVLDRVHDGNLERAMPPWVVETLQTKGAQIAVAADFTTRPIATVTIGTVSVPWLKGMRVARILGDFSPPGLNVAATLSYADAAHANDAAQGVRLLAGWLKMLAPFVGGATLQNLDVRTEAGDVLCKFAVSDQVLGTLVSLAPRLLPSLSPP
jgi:hypothetical protein